MRRADDARMQHPRHRHVVKISVFAGHDRRQVARHRSSPHQAVVGRRLDGRVRVDRNVERFAALQLRIGHAAIGLARLDQAVLDLQRAGVDTEVLGGARQHVAAGRRRRKPDR